MSGNVYIVAQLIVAGAVRLIHVRVADQLLCAALLQTQLEHVNLRFLTTPNVWILRQISCCSRSLSRRIDSSPQ